MIKDAIRGDMLAKFLGGNLTKRPLAAAPELLPTGAIGRGIVGMPRKAPGQRMAAGLVQELQGRRVPPSHPWYGKVMSNRGRMQSAQIEQAPVLWPKAAAQAMMGVSRMIPMVSGAKALAKRAPKVTGQGGAGQSLASMMKGQARGTGAVGAAPRPLGSSMPGMLQGGGRMPITPQRPPGITSSVGAAAPIPPLQNPGLTAHPMSPSGGQPPLRSGLQGLPQGFKGTFQNSAAPLKSAFAKFAMYKAVSPLARTILKNPAARSGVGTLPLPKGLSHLGNLRQQNFGSLPQHIQSAIANRHVVPELGGWSGGAGEMHEALRKYLGL